MSTAISPPAGVAIPAGMTFHELPVREQPLEFWGTELGTEDTDDGHRPRWAEFRLYRIVDTNPEHNQDLPGDDPDRDMFGRQLWLFYVVGRSLVYHAASGCNKGVLAKGTEFPVLTPEPLGDLVACEKCRPQDWRGSAEEFGLEVPYFSYTLHRTPQEVISSFYRKPRCMTCLHNPHKDEECCFDAGEGPCGCRAYKESPRAFSLPLGRLYDKVRLTDPDIAKAAAPAKRL